MRHRSLSISTSESIRQHTGLKFSVCLGETPRHNEGRTLSSLQVYVCPDSLQIKVPPSPPPSPIPSLPLTLSPFHFLPDPLSSLRRRCRPTIRARRFFAPLFSGSAPEHNSGQGDERNYFFIFVMKQGRNQQVEVRSWDSINERTISWLSYPWANHESRPRP